MKRVIKLVVVFCASLALPVFCFAQDLPETWAKLSIADNALSAPERKLIAFSLRNRFQEIKDFIPELKPSTRNWVQEERKKLKSLVEEDKETKIHEILDSTNIALVTFTDSLDKLLELSTSNKNPISIQKEMADWAEISSLLMNEAAFQSGLKKFGKPLKTEIPTEVRALMVGFDNFDPSMYDFVGKGITRTILLPYLRNEDIHRP